LAVLENRDLAASQEENKGAFEQAEAAYVTGTQPACPKNCKRPQAMLSPRENSSTQRRSSTTVDSSCSNKAPCLARTWIRPPLASHRRSRSMNLRSGTSTPLMPLSSIRNSRDCKASFLRRRGKFEGAQAQFSYSEIRSPIDGVVTDRPLYPGEMAASGATLMTVMDISRVTARAHIPQGDAALLRIGDRANIAVPELDQPVEGKVVLVSPALDPNSTTVEVWVQAKNPKQVMKPGSSVRLSMISEAIPAALVVPASAVLTGADGATTVMVGWR